MFIIINWIKALDIETGYGNAAGSPAYILGIVLSMAIFPAISWIMTFYLEKGHSKSQEHDSDSSIISVNEKTGSILNKQNPIPEDDQRINSTLINIGTITLIIIFLMYIFISIF